MNAGQCEKQPLRAIISLREQRRARLCDSRFVVVEIKMGNWNLDFFLLFFPFRWKKNCVIILSSKFSNENIRPFLLPGIRNFDLKFFARWELYRDKYIYIYIFFEQVFNKKIFNYLYVSRCKRKFWKISIISSFITWKTDVATGINKDY